MSSSGVELEAVAQVGVAAAERPAFAAATMSLMCDMAAVLSSERAFASSICWERSPAASRSWLSIPISSACGVQENVPSVARNSMRWAGPPIARAVCTDWKAFLSE